MNRREFREAIVERVGDNNYSLLEKQVYNRFINSAIKDIASTWEWPFLKVQSTVSTTAGVDTVEISTDVKGIKKVKLRDGSSVFNLKPEFDRNLQNSFPDPTNTGKPEYYTTAGLAHADPTLPPVYQLRLYCTPDAIYTLTVTYLRIPPSLADDDQYPFLPAEDFDEAIIKFSMKEFYRAIDDLANFDSVSNEYNEEITKLLSSYGAEFSEKFGAIR